MEFDWHDTKRESNLVKHGIDFVDITECLAQGDGLLWEDTRHDYGETRMNLMTEWHGRLVHITFTMRGDICWIISARFARVKEKKRYER